MSTQGLVYTITSRAQVPTLNTRNFKEAQNVSNPVISDYVSTANQTMIADSNENNAIRNNALASFTLFNNSAVSKLNSYVKKVELYEKLANA